jgi:hypothetical protein
MRILLAAAICTLLACQATADQAGVVIAACNQPNVVFGALRDQFNEVPVFAGNVGDGNGGGVVTITLSPDGSWSVLRRVSVDTLCILATGRGWQMLDPPAVKELSP